MFTEIDSVTRAVIQDDLLYTLSDGFMPSKIAEPDFRDSLFYEYPCSPICQLVQPPLKHILAVACNVGLDLSRNGLLHRLNLTVANWLRPVKLSAASRHFSGQLIKAFENVQAG